MNPERWQRIDEIFQAATDLPSDGRALFLDRICNGDAELRLEVESLLAFEAQDGKLIESAIVQAAGELPQAEDKVIGRRLGAYLITGVVGWGGMGTVYRAVRADDQFEKEVAIKLVKRGMDTDFVLDRFRRERQILARLDNPRIARMLDGGATDDGLPYFVMEFIEGKPITEYCEVNKLPIIEKLKLFRFVCAAVHFAHQSLIVHRDLKPSNILVTTDGVPKLLDFGIAKVLKSDDQMALTQTQTAVRMLTPDYASPELVRGETVTTATDVYSLGTVLYEMLTGSRAHQFKSHTTSEIERVVCHIDPEPPSAIAAARGDKRLARLLEDELDNIVLMAMRKEPDRRYGSVEQLSEDVRRHVEGLPIIARRDTIRYRTSKFVKRNKYVFAAMVTLFCTLIGGIITTTHQARRAERRFAEVRKLTTTFLFDFDQKIRRLPGSTELRESLVHTALEYLDSLAAEADDAELEWELASAYHKIADVQGSPMDANLGHTAAALASYGKALTLVEKLARSDPDNPKYKDAIAGNHYEIGDILERTGGLADAIGAYRKGLEISEKLVAGKADSYEYAEMVAAGHSRLGTAKLRMGDPLQAIEHARKVLEIEERGYRDRAGGGSMRNLASAYDKMADALLQAGDLDQAASYYRKEIAYLDQAIAGESNNWRLKRFLLSPYSSYGDLLGSPFYPSTGDRAGAVTYFRKALEIAEFMAQSDVRNVQGQKDLSAVLWRLGLALAESEPAGAEKLLKRAIFVSQSLIGNSPENLDYQRRHGLNYYALSQALRAKGDPAGALAALNRAIEIEEKGLDSAPDRIQFRQDLPIFHGAVGDIHSAAGRYRESAKSYARALDLAERLAREIPSSLLAAKALAATYESLGNLALKTGDSAVPWYRKSAELWMAWDKRRPGSSYVAKRKNEAEKLAAQAEPRTKLRAAR